MNTHTHDQVAANEAARGARELSPAESFVVLWNGLRTGPGGALLFADEPRVDRRPSQLLIEDARPRRVVRTVPTNPDMTRARAYKEVRAVIATSPTAMSIIAIAERARVTSHFTQMAINRLVAEGVVEYLGLVPPPRGRSAHMYQWKVSQ